MVLHDPLHHVLVSAIAERRICRHLAVAELVVARLSDVEGDRPVARDDPLALAVAERANLRVTTAAPVVDLALGEEHVRRVNTGEGGHAWRPVATLLVRARLLKWNNFLLGEIRHIVHRDAFARGRRLENLRFGSEYVTLVGLQLAASGANMVKMMKYLLDVDIALDLVPVGLLRLVILVRLEEVHLLIHL